MAGDDRRYCLQIQGRKHFPRVLRHTSLSGSTRTDRRGMLRTPTDVRYGVRLNPGVWAWHLAVALIPFPRLVTDEPSSPQELGEARR